MDEQETIKEDEQKKPDTNEGDGIQQKTISTLDRADQIAQMQKRENDRLDELISRQEALKATEKVGGVTEAGIKQEEKKEETPQEYVDKMRKSGWRVDG